MTQAPLDHFDQLFADDPDPWRYRTRWYEIRKRALLMACLPRPRFASAFEPGCAAGELTAQLAARCDAVFATDASEAAVAHARERLRATPNVRIECAALPGGWPSGAFDLVVFSELGYYLDADGLRSAVEACRQALTADGVLIACHWRHPASDFRQSGDDVHAAIARGIGLPRLLRHDEADFVLEAWSRDARSVAQREGLA